MRRLEFPPWLTWRALRLAAAALVAGSGPASATVMTIDDAGGVWVSGAAAPRIAPIDPVAAPLRASLTAAAQTADIDEALVAAIAWVESRYQPQARSPAGAIGIMQLMPATARELGVDPHDPSANLAGGAAYLRRLLDRFDGDLVRTIAAYNAGPNAVDRYRGVPPYGETRAYVGRVLARLASHALDPETRP